jgi:hypothetical protein
VTPFGRSRSVGGSSSLRSARTDDPVGATLGWLLRDRDARIPVSDTPAACRARLEQLRGKDILELEHGAYRATEIALYSSYQLRLPAAPPATDKHPGRFTDIDPDFR